MRVFKLRNFCHSESELEQIRQTLKLMSCPHCRRVGFLIAHGWARGYAEHGHERVVRGRRFFCSNRFRRQGCGLTVSVLLAHRLYGFGVGTRTLWSFLQAVLGGVSRKAAWEGGAGTFSAKSGYRLWQRMSYAQSHIRAQLAREEPPPASSQVHPLAQMVAHLEHTFAPQSGCPFAHFQSHFQMPLLP